MSWRIRAFHPQDTEGVVSLWEEAGLTRSWNDPRLDIERKMSVQPELFLIAGIPGGGECGSRAHRGNGDGGL